MIIRAFAFFIRPSQALIFSYTLSDFFRPTQEAHQSSGKAPAAAAILRGPL